MLLTEEEAKTKWCPHVRQAAPVDSEASGTAGNKYGKKQLEGAICMASACMAWRWFDCLASDVAGNQTWRGGRFNSPDAPGERHPGGPGAGSKLHVRRGYCGLSGKPEGE